MANQMSSWLGVDAKNIASGWPDPPQLSAPNIGELVKSILQNKLARDKMTQENIADTIKNVRQERQSNQYIKAAKEWGLIPQDYEAGGVGGATLGSNLAKLIQEQNQQGYMGDYYRAHSGLFGAQAEKERTIADYIKKYGTTPSSRGAGVDYSEHALGEVWIDEDSGLRMIQTTHGPKLAPVGVQPQTARTTAPNANMANQSTYDALQRQMFQLQNESAYEREANIKARKANVPFSRSDEMTQIQKQMDALNKPAATQDQDQTSGAGQTKMPSQKFGTEQDARNAGYQAGDTIQLFDPGTKTYRPYLLH
jgi:hypothetical protein